MSSYGDQLALRALPYFFAIALGLVFYFLKSDKPGAAIWAGFAAWIILGLVAVALIHEKVFSETETSRSEERRVGKECRL